MLALKIFGGIVGGVLAAFLLFVLLVIVSSLFIAPREYSKNSGYYRFLLNASTWLATVIGRMHLHATGLDRIPEGRFLLVSNHRSKFDPILSWYLLRDRDVAFISKPENFGVPFFGKIIRKCCFMAIDRENPRAAFATIHRAAELIKNGEVSVGVYPEGTRNSGSDLLPFHDGVFMIAQKANVPIVVLGIKGTIDIHKNFPKKRSDVYFDVIDVMDADFVASHRCEELSERARAGLADYLGIQEEKREVAS